jgi:ATP-dependent helicase HrpB
MGVDARTARSVDRAARQIRAIAADTATRPAGIDAVDAAVQISVFAGFADRLARRKNRADRDLILSTGRSARLADTSVVHDATLMVALDADENPGRGITVRLASAVDPSWVFDLCPRAVDMSDELSWSGRTESVVRVSRIALGSVVLEEDEQPAPPSDAASEILLANARSKGRTAWDTGERLTTSVRKLSLLGKHVPELGLSETDTDLFDRALASPASGGRSFPKSRKWTSRTSCFRS